MLLPNIQIATLPLLKNKIKLSIIRTSPIRLVNRVISPAFKEFLFWK